MNPRRWFEQLGIAVDQLANVLITPLQGSAWADETLSARAWRAERDAKVFGRIFRPTIDRLFFWERAHCRTAYEREQQRMHIAPEYRPTR